MAVIVIIIAIGIWYSILFKKFCEKVAILEGRLEEAGSIFRGELGANSFEIEQFGEIISGGYRKSNDGAVKVLGDRLFFLTVLVVIITLMFVLLVAGTESDCL